MIRISSSCVIWWPFTNIFESFHGLAKYCGTDKHSIEHLILLFASFPKTSTTPTIGRSTLVQHNSRTTNKTLEFFKSICWYNTSSMARIFPFSPSKDSCKTPVFKSAKKNLESGHLEISTRFECSVVYHCCRCVPFFKHETDEQIVCFSSGNYTHREIILR